MSHWVELDVSWFTVPIQLPRPPDEEPDPVDTDEKVTP